MDATQSYSTYAQQDANKINWLELHMYACLLKCRFYNKILREKSFISESIPGNNSTK